MKKLSIDIAKALLFLSIGVFLIWLVTKDLTESDKANIYSAFHEAEFSTALPCSNDLTRLKAWKV